MKKYQISLWCFLLVGWCSFAQSPNWQVQENDYQYTMTFVAFLNIDGQDLNDSNDLVAAFVDGECRGVTQLSYVETQGQYYAYLTVFSNTNGESIDFKIYDASRDVIRDITGSETFAIDQHYGNLFQAYSIADPALNATGNLLNADLMDVQVNDQINTDDTVLFYVDPTADLTAVTLEFELSIGAELYFQEEQLISGSNIVDLSNPITIKVVSQDRSAIREYSIMARKSSGEVSYYKKDAVCYQGGAIKVVAITNGEEVNLLKGNETIKTGSILNGEYTFENLEAGEYSVKVSGNAKNITINLKN